MTRRAAVPKWKAAMSGQRALTPNERPWDPPFTYACDGGHEVAADRSLTACPVCVHGEKCAAILRRVGTGSGRGSNLARSA